MHRTEEVLAYMNKCVRHCTCTNIQHQDTSKNEQEVGQEMIFTYFERVSSGSFNILLPPMICLLFKYDYRRLLLGFMIAAAKDLCFRWLHVAIAPSQQASIRRKFTMRDVKK